MSNNEFQQARFPTHTQTPLTSIITESVKFGPFCYVTEDVKLGRRIVIYPYASIGTPAEFDKHPVVAYFPVEIGDDVVIREHVTINKGFARVTKIGNACYLMAKSHVGHDSVLGSNVKLATGAIVGGHSTVGQGSYIGLNAVLHQNSEIGPYCMIGANAFFKGTSPAAIIWVGVPARPIGVNIVGLERAGITGELFEQYVKDAEAFILEQEMNAAKKIHEDMSKVYSAPIVHEGPIIKESKPKKDKSPKTDSNTQQ